MHLFRHGRLYDGSCCRLPDPTEGTLLKRVDISHRWRRHKYKSYVVEVLLELILPIVIVGVGGFASGTALKTVNFNCLNGC